VLTIPLATSPDQTMPASGLSLPAATVDQLAAPAQSSSRFPVEGQAGLTGVDSASVTRPLDLSATNGKNGIKDASGDATSTKLRASFESNQPKLQRDSQETTPSSDQGQNSSASQGQNSVRPEMNSASHAVALVAAAQAIVNTSQAQNSAIPAGATAHTARALDNATPAQISVPQALPVINTAKLIPSMDQSEIRVGMRSTEFGSISIGTPSTQDLISAQIPLDHGTQELRSSAELNRHSIATPNGSSNAAPNAVRIGMQDSLPHEDVKTPFSDETNASSVAAPRAVQNAASNVSPNEERYSVQGADLSGL
jgi:hypothetical protein